MKGEESPDVSKRNMERDLKILQQISCTPKGKKIGLDDLHLLGLHRDCSPNDYGSSQDKLEIGWGDSPEPLNIEQKSRLCATQVACKKRLEAKESPKSRCRNIRPSIRPLANSPVDVSKYIAEVQALSKRIMTEIENEKQNSETVKEEGKENSLILDKSLNGDPLDLLNEDDLTNEYLIACSQSLENSLATNKESCMNSSNQRNEKGKERKSFGGIGCSKQLVCNESSKHQQQQQQQHSDFVNSTSVNNDSAFEKVLQTFISEEDDWLSQVALTAEAKITPRKSGFVKTRSENQLTSTSGSYKNDIPLSRRSSGLSSTFRRTYSSDRVGSNDCSKIISSSNVSGKPRENSNLFINNSNKKSNFFKGKSTVSDPQRKGFR